MQLMVTQS